jgi:two-component system NtrC family sensor kinase
MSAPAVECGPRSSYRRKLNRGRRSRYLNNRSVELETLLANVPDTIIRVDCDLRITYANSICEAYSGLSQSHFLGKTLEELGYPADIIQQWRPSVVEVIRSGQRRNVEVLFPTVFGMQAFAVVFVPEFDIDGLVLSVLAVGRNVTEQRIVKERLMLVEQALAQCASGVVVSDAKKPNYPIVYMNKTAELMTGFTAEQAVDNPALGLAGSNNDADVLDAIAEAHRAGTEVRVLVNHVDAESKKRWADLHVSPIRNSAGDVTHFVGISTDVTESIEANARLVEQQQFIRKVVDAVPSSILVKDSNGRYVLVNQAFCDLHKVTEADVIGHTDAELGMPPDFARDRMRTDQQVWSTGEPVVIPESEYVTLSGKRCIIQGVKIPVQFGGNNTTHILGIATDITERKSIEERMRQSYKLAALGQTVAGVAHELNNPLAVIRLTAQLLLFEADEKQKKDIGSIVHMADRAADIVRSLLTFARNDTGTRKQCDLNECVNLVLNILKPSLKKTDVVLDIDLPPGLPLVTVNPNQIQQVILNLIANAEDAVRENPRDSQVVRISTRARVNEHGARAVELVVSDNGPGIPEEIRPRVFDPFFTTKEVGQGTGLGLSICHGIVTAHGGEIDFKHVQPHGTVFEVRLPVDEVARPEN